MLVQLCDLQYWLKSANHCITPNFHYDISAHRGADASVFSKTADRITANGVYHGDAVHLCSILRKWYGKCRCFLGDNQWLVGRATVLWAEYRLDSTRSGRCIDRTSAILANEQWRIRTNRNQRIRKGRPFNERSSSDICNFIFWLSIALTTKHNHNAGVSPFHALYLPVKNML